MFIAGSRQIMELQRRTDMSFWTRIFQTVLRPFGNRLVIPSQPHPGGSPEVTAPNALLRVCDFKADRVDDINIYEITQKEAATPPVGPKRRILYFPGGGWQGPTSSGHWPMLQELAMALENTAVTLVSYPLVPHDPAPTTFPKLEKLYDTLLLRYQEAGESVILAGDSAGGNLALALTVNALNKTEDALCPQKLVVISPCCDLRHLDEQAEPALSSIAQNDPFLTIRIANATTDAWRDTWEASDPRLSVSLADVSVLAARGVRVYGITGGYDLLAPGAERFRDECHKAGVGGKWLSWEGQMHIFPLFFWLGLFESKEVKKWILKAMEE